MPDNTSKSENASLTGVWHGIYTYPSAPHMPESHYVCVLIDNNGRLTGTVHETMNHYRRASTEETAVVEGYDDNGQVSFLKTYVGGSKSHSVSYLGMLSADRDEIEGEWHVHESARPFSGAFLMIRKRGTGESAAVEAFQETY